MHKYCSKCKSTTNSFGEPYVTINGKSYYYCRICKNKRAKKYYDRVKSDVFEHYGKKCICCGEDEFLFLSIDHINNDGNKHRTSSGVRITGIRLYSHIRAKGFPKTYQVLCRNCNFGKHMNKGVCPHSSKVVE